MKTDTLNLLFENHKEQALSGRYISYEHIAILLQKHRKHFDVVSLGASVLGIPIDVISIGKGPKKILMWSQMHGNESTTTKAVFDLCNTLCSSKDPDIVNILKTCTIAILPMLNPDGAKAYTRVNANQIDLNRDAQDLSQPESIILRHFFDSFQPDFCFNLHGQRTIFSAGKRNLPATISFLAPAQDEACTITNTRKKAMEVIVNMNEHLQKQIPDQVGIYDDAFNLNCVGDTFQSLEVPTVLFEAGHYADDYQRDVVRKYMFQSLMVGIDYIASHTVIGECFNKYQQIPQNQKLFYDIIIRNAVVKAKVCDIAIQYDEIVKDAAIIFKPKIDSIGNLDSFYGHREVNANQNRVVSGDDNELYVGYANDFVLINNEIFSLKLE